MKNKLLLLLCALFVGMSVRAQVDVTNLYIQNATLSKLDGWTKNNFANPVRGNNTVGYATESYAGWGSLEKTEYSLTQTVTLPAGHYTLVNYGFYREGLSYDTDPETSRAFLKAGEEQVPLATLGSIALVRYPNSQAEGADAFDAMMYRNTLDFTVEYDGAEVEIGIAGTFEIKQSWIIAGMFQLFNNDLTPGDEDTFDMTYKVFNPSFEGCNTGDYGMEILGWTKDNDLEFKIHNSAQTWKVGQMFAESWQASGALPAASYSQVVSELPNGLYSVSANLSGNGTFIGAGSGDTYTQAVCDGTTGKYNTVIEVKDGNDLTIKFGMAEGGTTNWAALDNIRLERYLTYKGYATAILNTITYPIEGVGDKDVKAAYDQAYNDFKTFVDGIVPGDDTTLDDINNAKATFDAAEAAWKASIEKWSNYEATAERAKKLYDQITSQTGKYVENNALNALNTYVNASASAAEPGYKDPSGVYTFVNGNYAYIIEHANLNEEQLAAEVSFLNSLTNDVKKKSVQDGMDVTFLLVNPDFTDPTEYYGWTTTRSGSVNWQYRRGLSGWPTSECYAHSDGPTFDIYQELESAPAGLYEVSINAFYRLASGETKVPVELYMGTISSPIQSINEGKILNDLVLDTENHVYTDGEVAKNGTNCYFWDGNTENFGVGKEVWKLNQNEDPAVQQLMINSEDLTDAGKYGADAKVTEDEVEYLIPASMEGASIAFSGGRYTMKVYGEVPDEGDGVGKLKIGIKTTTPMKGTGWSLWGGFKLKLAGKDVEAMRALLAQKLDILWDIFSWDATPEGPCLTLQNTVNEKVFAFRALIEDSEATYEDLKDAYDETVVLIDRSNEYLEAYKDYTQKNDKLSDMIATAEGDPAKAATKAFAEDVQTVYSNLVSIGFLATNEEDVNDLKAYMEGEGIETEDITEANMHTAAVGDPEDPDKSSDAGYYVSTYAKFNEFFNQISEKMDCIYLSVDGVSTAENPQDITEQLHNPDFVETETTDDNKWWGTAWKNLGSNEAAEQYENVFDTYQNVYMPAGYYTIVAYAMDRRGTWADVLANNADWRAKDATMLYVVGDNIVPVIECEGDTAYVETANAKYVAMPEDITAGEPEETHVEISSYEVGDPAVTYYAPNTMEQYRHWMDNKGDINFGVELKFYVPEDSYAKLGFFRRAQETGSWFVADSIKLFYAVDAEPETTGIVAPTSLEKFGKADGKYLEKNQIFIYLNGKKFNTAGQIVK